MSYAGIGTTWCVATIFFKHEPIVKLKFHLTYILVKLMRIKATKLNGFQEGVIPVEVLVLR
jgi:hypothetical protein